MPGPVQNADSVSIQQFNRQAMRRTQNVQLWCTLPMGCALIATDMSVHRTPTRCVVMRPPARPASRANGEASFKRADSLTTLLGNLSIMRQTSCRTSRALAGTMSRWTISRRLLPNLSPPALAVPGSSRRGRGASHPRSPSERLGSR